LQLRWTRQRKTKLPRYHKRRKRIQGNKQKYARPLRRFLQFCCCCCTVTMMMVPRWWWHNWVVLFTNKIKFWLNQTLFFAAKFPLSLKWIYEFFGGSWFLKKSKRFTVYKRNLFAMEKERHLYVWHIQREMSHKLQGVVFKDFALTSRSSGLHFPFLDVSALTALIPKVSLLAYFYSIFSVLHNFF
jgi:hypothetical protein